MSTDEKIDRAFHALEFAYMVRDCGGMTDEVAAFGRAMNIDVDGLKRSYALESYGSKTLEQVAMEGVLDSIHTWIVEHKRTINTVLTGLFVVLRVKNVAMQWSMLRSFGVTIPTIVAGLAIDTVVSFYIRRGILGLFNSLPGAIKAALSIKLPTDGSGVEKYKNDVRHALKIRLWEKEAGAARDASIRADEKNSQYSVTNPPKQEDIVEAVKAASDAATTAKNLEFVPDALEKMTQSAEAKTPAGAAALRWLTLTVSGLITDASRHAGKLINESAKLSKALDKHTKK